MYGSLTENVVFWINFLLKNLCYIFCRRYLMIFKKIGFQNVTTEVDDFESRLCAQTH